LAAPGGQPRGAGVVSASHRIASDHPSFEGHFPGHPLLPGVVLLTLVMRSLERSPSLRQRIGATVCIEQVKFLAPVGPGSEVVVELRKSGRGVSFECRVGPRPVARGQLRCAGAAP